MKRCEKSSSSDVKPIGAVTIYRNGYIKEVENERDLLSAKLDRILELTTHDDTYWAIEEIGRVCDSPDNVKVHTPLPASASDETGVKP